MDTEKTMYPKAMEELRQWLEKGEITPECYKEASYIIDNVLMSLNKYAREEGGYVFIRYRTMEIQVIFLVSSIGRVKGIYEEIRPRIYQIYSEDNATKVLERLKIWMQ
jgi:hypothetical protein